MSTDPDGGAPVDGRRSTVDEPPGEVPPREALLEIELSLRVIGAASRPDLIDRIGDQAPDLRNEMEQVIEEVPRAVGIRIRDALLELSAGHPAAATVAASAADPRNYREAAAAVSLASVSGDEAVVRASASSLQTILPGLSSFAKFLASADRRGREALEYQDGTATVGDASVSVRSLSDLLSELRGWHRVRAVRPALEAQPSGLSSFHGIPDYPDDEGAWAPELGPAALLSPPDPTAERKLASDLWPLTSGLRPLASDLSAPLELSSHVHLRAEEGLDAGVREELERSVAAALRVFSLIVQRPMFSILDDSTIVLHPEEAATAWLVPQSRTIHVFAGASAPELVLHELGHLLDARLGGVSPGPVFRTEQEESAIGAFAHAAALLCEPVARARARRYAEGLWAAAQSPCGEKEGRRKEEGPPAEHPLLGEVAAPEEDDGPDREATVDGRRSAVHGPSRRPLRALLEELSFVSDPDEAVDAFITGRAEDLASEGTPTSRAERALLCSIQDGLEVDGEDLVVDVDETMRSLEEAELERLLSPPEVFARFFDQYGRLLSEKKGFPLSTRPRPCDLPIQSVLRLAPTFLSALLSEQERYLSERADHLGQGQLRESLIAIVVAAGGALGAVLASE